MKKQIFLSWILFLLSGQAEAMNAVELLGCLDCYNFTAPKIDGEQLGSPANGLIVYDTKYGMFRGYSSASGWNQLSKIKFTATIGPGDPYPVSADVVFCHATSTMSVLLPAAATMKGREVTFKKQDSSFLQVVLTPNGSETIDGAASKTLNTYGEVMKIASDGINWSVVERDIPSSWTSYTPTAGSPWVVSSWNCKYRRDRSDLLLRCIFDGTTTGSTEARITLPDGVTPQILSITRVGSWMNATRAPYMSWVLLEPGVNYLTFGRYGSPGFTKETSGNVVMNSPPFTTSASIHLWDVRIPISGW